MSNIGILVFSLQGPHLLAIMPGHILRGVVLLYAIFELLINSNERFLTLVQQNLSHCMSLRKSQLIL